MTPVIEASAIANGITKARPLQLVVLTLGCLLSGYIIGFLRFSKSQNDYITGALFAPHVSALKSSSALTHETFRTAPARAAVIASAADNIGWLLQAAPELCLLPYSPSDAAVRHHAWESAPNRGREASIYLRFIIDHYDNLPDRTVFLHGHGESWHAVRIAQILRHLNWSLPYANLNYSPYEDVWRDFGTDHPDLADYHPLFQQYWDDLWAEGTGLTSPPSRFRVHCCAQFMVSRDLLLRRSKAWYQKALTWVQEGDDRFANDTSNAGPDARAAVMFEFTWEYIFLGPDHLQYRHCHHDLGQPTDCDICAVVKGCVNGTGFDTFIAERMDYEPFQHSRLRNSYPCGPWASRQ